MRGNEATKESNGGPAIIFAVFAIVCLTAFLAFRGNDVGQLTGLIGNLGGGSLFGSGIVQSAFGVLIALCIYSAWYGLGRFLLRFLPSKISSQSVYLYVNIRVAFGAAAWSLIWFVLGLLGLYSLFWGAAALVISGLLGIFARKPNYGETKDAADRSERLAFFDKVAVAFILIPILLSYIGALAPPTAKDTLLYHFAVPKAFIAQQSSSFIDGNIASYLALGSEMHSVWAMLLGGYVSPRAAEVAAGVTAFLFFPILLWAIYGWAREIGVTRGWSLIATLIIAAIPTAFHIASSGYIDIALALYVTLAIYSLTLWWKQPSTGAIILVGVFLGAALSIKLTAVFVFAAFALVVLVRARETQKSAGKVVAGGFAALILAAAIASPWFIRTWAATGSPVFPFYMSIWKGEAAGWDVERSNLFQEMNKAYGGENKTVASYLLAPWNLSVAAQPEQAANFDGVLGVSFLFGLPVLVWGLWKYDLPVEAKIGSGVAAVMFLFWLFSSEQLRYLLPILPVLALSIVAAAQAISGARKGLRQVLQIGFAAAALAALLVTAAWFCQKAPLRVALGGETRDQYLTRNLDYYPFYQTINTDTAADAKVWLINMRRDTYNIERPVFSDYMFEDWTLRKMVWDSRNTEELKARTAAMGIKYVLTRHDFLFDYDRSTLVDDKKPRAENEAKLRIAKEFILDPANTIKADNKFSLIKVF